MNKLKESSVLQDLTQEVSDSNKSDTARVIDILTNDMYQKRKTRFHKNIVADFSFLYTVAQIYDIDILLQFFNYYMQCLISVDGKGRQEIVDIMRASVERDASRHDDLMKLLGRR